MRVFSPVGPRVIITRLLPILVVAAMAAAVGCGGGAKTLSQEETKQILRAGLPYRFEFRPVETPEGASGAVAGRVYGPHGTAVRFGVSLGPDGEPVSLGPDTDFADATGGESFRVTSDIEEIVDGKIVLGRQLQGRKQWNVATTMVVDIEERLCRETEGHACAI